MSVQPIAHKPGLGLRLGQGGWATIVLIALGLFFVSAPRLYAWLDSACVETTCSSIRLSPAAVRNLAQLGLSFDSYALLIFGLNLFVALFGLVVAAVIVWRRPNDWFALLVALMLILSGLGPFYEPLQSSYYTSASPDAPAQLLTFLAGVLSQVQAPALIFFLVLFPDGRFVPRWTRWLVVLWPVVLLALFLPMSPFSPDQSPWASGLIWVTILFTAVGSQIYRYLRVSGVIQRQQSKWLVFGLSINFLLFLPLLAVFVVTGQFSPPPGSVAALLQTLSNILFQLSLTATLAFAILRYRLWDIDILIRRTVTYSILTVLLGVIYFGGVVLLDQLTRSFTETSDLAIVVSTLVIAALFFPLRRRVQNVIDRRFYRRKYDAARTLAAFSATVRDEVELEKLTAELINVVDETMGPKSVSLWLRRTEREVTR